MVLYKRKYTAVRVYNFVGDEHEWRKLIIGNSKNFKNVYLCDVEANRRMYPPEVKVINSIKTAQRFQFTRFNKAIAFIGDLDQWKWLTIDWFGMEYVILRTDFKGLMDLLTLNLVEKSSRRNISNIRIYK